MQTYNCFTTMQCPLLTLYFEISGADSKTYPNRHCSSISSKGAQEYIRAHITRQSSEYPVEG